MCEDNKRGSQQDSTKPIIAIGSDHAGYEVKNVLVEVLKKQYNCVVVDQGVFSTQPSDYPDIAKEVARKVSNGEVDKGILICATGIGMSIVANKFKGVRAAVCHNKIAATYSVKHNNANVLCLGSRVNTLEEILEILKTWFSSSFEGERHLQRINKISQIEKEINNTGSCL